MEKVGDPMTAMSSTSQDGEEDGIGCSTTQVDERDALSPFPSFRKPLHETPHPSDTPSPRPPVSPSCSPPLCHSDVMHQKTPLSSSIQRSMQEKRDVPSLLPIPVTQDEPHRPYGFDTPGEREGSLEPCALPPPSPPNAEALKRPWSSRPREEEEDKAVPYHEERERRGMPEDVPWMTSLIDWEGRRKGTPKVEDAPPPRIDDLHVEDRIDGSDGPLHTEVRTVDPLQSDGLRTEKRCEENVNGEDPKGDTSLSISLPQKDESGNENRNEEQQNGDDAADGEAIHSSFSLIEEEGSFWRRARRSTSFPLLQPSQNSLEGDSVLEGERSSSPPSIPPPEHDREAGGRALVYPEGLEGSFYGHGGSMGSLSFHRRTNSCSHWVLDGFDRDWSLSHSPSESVEGSVRPLGQQTQDDRATHWRRPGRDDAPHRDASSSFPSEEEEDPIVPSRSPSLPHSGSGRLGYDASLASRASFRTSNTSVPADEWKRGTPKEDGRSSRTNVGPVGVVYDEEEGRRSGSWPTTPPQLRKDEFGRPLATHRPRPRGPSSASSASPFALPFPTPPGPSPPAMFLSTFSPTMTTGKRSPTGNSSSGASSGSERTDTLTSCSAGDSSASSSPSFIDRFATTQRGRAPLFTIGPLSSPPGSPSLAVSPTTKEVEHEERETAAWEQLRKEAQERQGKHLQERKKRGKLEDHDTGEDEEDEDEDGGEKGGAEDPAYHCRRAQSYPSPGLACLPGGLHGGEEVYPCASTPIAVMKRTRKKKTKYASLFLFDAASAMPHATGREMGMEWVDHRNTEEHIAWCPPHQKSTGKGMLREEDVSLPFASPVEAKGGEHKAGLLEDQEKEEEEEEDVKDNTTLVPHSSFSLDTDPLGFRDFNPTSDEEVLEAEVREGERRRRKLSFTKDVTVPSMFPDDDEGAFEEAIAWTSDASSLVKRGKGQQQGHVSRHRCAFPPSPFPFSPLLRSSPPTSGRSTGGPNPPLALPAMKPTVRFPLSRASPARLHRSSPCRQEDFTHPMPEEEEEEEEPYSSPFPQSSQTSPSSRKTVTFEEHKNVWIRYEGEPVASETEEEEKSFIFTTITTLDTSAATATTSVSTRTNPPPPPPSSTGMTSTRSTDKKRQEECRLYPHGVYFSYEREEAGEVRQWWNTQRGVQEGKGSREGTEGTESHAWERAGVQQKGIMKKGSEKNWPPPLPITTEDTHDATSTEAIVQEEVPLSLSKGGTDIVWAVPSLPLSPPLSSPHSPHPNRLRAHFKSSSSTISSEACLVEEEPCPEESRSPTAQDGAATTAVPASATVGHRDEGEAEGTERFLQDGAAVSSLCFTPFILPCPSSTEKGDENPLLPPTPIATPLLLESPPRSLSMLPHRLLLPRNSFLRYRKMRGDEEDADDNVEEEEDDDTPAHHSSPTLVRQELKRSTPPLQLFLNGVAKHPRPTSILRSSKTIVNNHPRPRQHACENPPHGSTRPPPPLSTTETTSTTTHHDEEGTVSTPHGTSPSPLLLPHFPGVEKEDPISSPSSNNTSCSQPSEASVLETESSFSSDSTFIDYCSETVS